MLKIKKCFICQKEITFNRLSKKYCGNQKLKTGCAYKVYRTQIDKFTHKEEIMKKRNEREKLRYKLKKLNHP